MTVEALLAREREAVEESLHDLFPAAGEWPDRLWQAMAHAVFAGGKRIRPVLARLAHRAAGGDPAEITYSACGLELIHTYSLVHDDLPALDDDVLRRGQPTVHVAFDEATAILVGDASAHRGPVADRAPPGRKRMGRTPRRRRRDGRRRDLSTRHGRRAG